MKVLHIISGDLTGGAARGAYWLHQGLLNLGMDSHILTSSKETFGDKSVTSITVFPKQKFFNLLKGQADGSLKKIYPDRRGGMFSTGFFGYNLTQSKVYQETDIVHLHWICNGFINIKDLHKVKKPIVWTMRDMWPMTGGCHYSMECQNFLTGCGQCVQLGSSFKYDLSWIVLKRKEKYLNRDIKLVGISDWLSEQAKASYLFKNFSIQTIYNNIKTSIFFPIDKNTARFILNISANKKIILAGVCKTSAYKGLEKFIQALSHLNPDDYYLCFFGDIDLTNIDKLGFEYKHLGFLHDNVTLRLAYSCADVFVSPSLMEAFGKTITESMACGTPAVCFNATGPKDIVTHKIDGYKAEPFDPKDLADGIKWVCENPNYPELCENARNKVINKFDNEVVAKQYIDLYKEIMAAS